MGRINNRSGIEIIPLVNHRANRSTNFPAQRSKKMERMPYMADPTIVPRVQKYLESNVDKTYVDINVMADYLQRTYREYSRLKRNPFRASVKKAYSIVLQSYGIQDQENSSSDEEDDSDDSAPVEASSYNNLANNQLASLLSQPQVPKRIDENELIDISSDDSDDNDNEKTNGPSTSIKEAKTVVPSVKPETKERLPYVSRKRKGDSAAIAAFQSPSKKKKSLATLHEPSVTFKDLGGIDNVLVDVCDLLTHVQNPVLYRRLGVAPPRGFLLHGPPGCGKTLLANAIAGEIGVPLLKVAAPELVAGVSGESEERIRELFERAVCSKPCILFIDEIDAITPNRQYAQKEMERRIVAQLLTCLDELSQNECGDKVLVIGATNRPDAIDPALRRAGRFDSEIRLGIPDVQARIQILKVVMGKLTLSEGFDFETLAKLTPGYVGADLSSLASRSARIAVKRMLKQHQAARKAALAAEEKRKREAALAAAAAETNKSDPEIIVDDDLSKEDDVTVVVTKEPPIVVIDEEVKQPSDDAPSATPNAGAAAGGESAVNGHLVKPDDDKSSPADADPEIVVEEVAMALVAQESSRDGDVSAAFRESLEMLHGGNMTFTDEELEAVRVTIDDCKMALKGVQPSSKREGFATIPDVSWDDVGSLTAVRAELQMAILAPIRHKGLLEEYGLTTPAGILLCGPPGCGKTLVAKALANEAGINFLSVKGPELLNMYVGESERAVRVCFERARNSAPCVIFFDEFDAICPRRSDNSEGGATARVVTQMLTEMDGVEDRQEVYLLAASNRPDTIDPAVLRPGRFDKILYVGLPTPSDRADILRAITKNGTKPRLAPDVDLNVIGSSEKCQGYTGADLAALVRKASSLAVQDLMLGNMQAPRTVSMTHFHKAFATIRPSVSEKDQKHYERFRKMYAPPVPEQSDVEEMEYT